MRHARHMDVMAGEEEKERCVLVGFDPFVGAFYPFITEIFIPESGRVTSCVKADTADAIVNGVIVTMAPV